MLTVISGGTIEFRHTKPPRGAHKTYAKWIERRLEKVTPIQLSSDAYHQVLGASLEAGHDLMRERRSDNKLVMVIGDLVFSNSEYERKRMERIAREQGR